MELKKQQHKGTSEKAQGQSKETREGEPISQIENLEIKQRKKPRRCRGEESCRCHAVVVRCRRNGPRTTISTELCDPADLLWVFISSSEKQKKPNSWPLRSLIVKELLFLNMESMEIGLKTWMEKKKRKRS